MANWDFVFAYDERAAGWLDEQGYPRPEVLSGNRLPTTADVKWAASRDSATPEEYPLLIDDFDWENNEFVPDDAFKLRGEFNLELEFLTKLCQRCGQLWVYMDTGEPAIVVDDSMSPIVIAETYRKAATMEDSWQYFHEHMYGNRR